MYSFPREFLAWEILGMRKSGSPASFSPELAQAHARHGHFGSIIWEYVGETPTDLDLEQ